MKKNLLKAILFVVFAVFAVSCTDEQSAVEMNENELNLKATGSVWDSVIGVEQNGQYVITVPKDRLLEEMQKTVKDQGYNDKLTDAFIVKKTASNDPSVEGFLLIGTTAPNSPRSFSTGVMLVQNASFQFTVDKSFAKTSCTGCSSGCNLRFLTEGTQKIPYCDANGCVYNCVKSESSFY